MRITSLTITGVGAFENQTFDFNREPIKPEGKAEIHLFVGQNGTGKTTILQTLAASLDRNMPTIYVKKIRGNRPIDAHVFLTKFSEGNDVRGNGMGNVLGGDKLKGTLAFAYSGSRKLYSTKVEADKEIIERPAENALDFEKSVSSEILSQWIWNTIRDAALYREKGDSELAERHRLALSQIEKAVKDLIGKEEFKFTFEVKPPSVGVMLNRKNLEFDVLPDGLKSIISWIGDLMMRLHRLDNGDFNTPINEQAFILLLDEIEIHLHPSWQRKILPVVRGLFPNAQIFIATHSPFVVSSIEGAWVHKLGFDESGNAKLIETMPSLGGSSYLAAVEEVFGITEYFDVQTEKDLKNLRQYKLDILQGKKESLEPFKKLCSDLEKRGIEIGQIVGREQREVNRFLQNTLQVES